MKLSYYRNKADRALQEANRRLKPKCEFCGKDSQVGHHFFPKSTASALRYDMSNIVSLCNGCHFSHHNGNPQIHARIILQRGEQWYKDLLKRKSQIIKPSKSYYLQQVSLCQTY